MHTKKSGGEFSIHAELTQLSVCALFICVCVCVCVCVCARLAGIFSHSARLLLQQSRAFYTLALWLHAVFISSPDTWDWTRMHRRTLYENVDSVKIKVIFYTTDIDILLVASMHCIVIHYIDISIHIDESLHTPKKYSISITSYEDKSLVSIIIKQQHEDMAQLLNVI